MASDDSGVYPWDVELECCVVDEEPDFEVIGSVEDEVDIFCEGGDVGVVDVGDDWFDGDFAVDLFEFFCGGDCFGEMLLDVVFVKQNLPLEIAEFDEISVDNS